MTTPWELDGAPVVDENDNIIECEDCPCDDDCDTLCNVGAVAQLQLVVPSAMFYANAADSGDTDQWCSEAECDVHTNTRLLDKVEDPITVGLGATSDDCAYRSADYSACTFYIDPGTGYEYREQDWHWVILFSAVDPGVSPDWFINVYLRSEANVVEHWRYQFTPPFDCETGFTVPHLGTAGGFDFEDETNCNLDRTEDLLVQLPP